MAHPAVHSVANHSNVTSSCETFASAFEVGSELNGHPIVLLVMVLFFALIAWALHVTTEKVDRSIRRHAHMKVIIAAVYKELMIIGVVAFVVSLVHQSALMGTLTQDSHESHVVGSTTTLVTFICVLF
jgi:hypothetical protein